MVFVFVGKSTPTFCATSDRALVVFVVLVRLLIPNAPIRTNAIMMKRSSLIRLFTIFANVFSFFV